MKIDVSWPVFKTLLTDRNLECRYIESDGHYFISSQDGSNEINTIIEIVVPALGGSDQEDFEVSYKTNSNTPSTIPLPIDASTATLQTSGNSSLSSINNKLPAALGQQVAADSLPIVSSLEDKGFISQATGNITGTGNSVALSAPGVGAFYITVEGSWAGSLTVKSNYGAVQTLSFRLVGSSTAQTSITANGLYVVEELCTQDIIVTSVSVTGGGADVTIDAYAKPTGFHSWQAGTWNVGITGTVPLPTGAATVAKQPALGTAGTASADVISVQGIASMTALKVDGSAVTQPVSIATAPVLVAGSAIIGNIRIDQTTPGTTNGVQINAGSAVIGHIIADTGSTTAVTGNVAVTNAGLTNIDVASSTLAKSSEMTTQTAAINTLLKPANTLAAVTTVSTVTAVTAITNALPVGANVIGKVSIDQTTPGTTNAVSAVLTTGAAAIGKLTANSGVTIGAVEIAASQTITQTPVGANTTAVTTVAASASSVRLFSASASRRFGSVYNDSTVNCRVKLGGTASATSFTVLLLPGDYYELPGAPNGCYTNVVDAIWDSATGNARITDLST